MSGAPSGAGAAARDRTAPERGHLDRTAWAREDEPWLREAWNRPDTRVLRLAAGRALARNGEHGPELVLTSPAEAPADAERFFLGTDGDGVAYFACAAGSLPERRGEGVRPLELGEAAHALGERDHGMLTHATALENWHRAHGHCPRCGDRTAPGAAGHVRRCAGCGTEHYPRTDPAVIMLITDEYDRCLLGNRVRWPEGQFSVLAGYVEPGETAEEAVRREAVEEAGVVIGDVRYAGTQPHPFPGSLMLGFEARAETPRARADGEEMSAVRWFTREELRVAVAGGEVALPHRTYIARRLIEGWYGEPLSSSAHWDD